MIDRQECYSALFTLKNSGIDIEEQLSVMKESKGVPRKVIEFLRDNSPQFQFYRYIQKYQKALAESILDYESLSNLDKLITCSSFVTRVMIAVKYKNLSDTLLDDLKLSEVSEAVSLAVSADDYSKINEVLSKHNEALRLFYKPKGGKRHD